MDVHRPAVSGKVHQEAGVVAVFAMGDAATQGASRSRPDALNGEDDVGRRRRLLLDFQTEAPKEFPHGRATPWLMAAKVFAAYQEIPPDRDLPAPKLRETLMFLCWETHSETGPDRNGLLFLVLY